MRLSTVSSLAMMLAIAACNTEPVEYTPGSTAATAENSTANQQPATDNTQNQGAPEADVDDADTDVDPNDGVEATPVVDAPKPLTNADLLAMDTVVVTAVIDADDGVLFYSDVNNTKVTAQADMSAQNYLAGLTLITEAAPLQVKQGQKMEFCVIAAEGNSLRIHTNGGGGDFGHWGGGQQLAMTECSIGQDFPGTLAATAPRELYNHNGDPDSSPIFITVVQ